MKVVSEHAAIHQATQKQSARKIAQFNRVAYGRKSCVRVHDPLSQV